MACLIFLSKILNKNKNRFTFIFKPLIINYLMKIKNVLYFVKYFFIYWFPIQKLRI
jgi:hypothetical protein